MPGSIQSPGHGLLEGRPPGSTDQSLPSFFPADSPGPRGTVHGHHRQAARDDGQVALKDAGGESTEDTYRASETSCCGHPRRVLRHTYYAAFGMKEAFQ